MELSITELAPNERYKILAGVVFPRPIALISTYSENGVANCAPYSFFNAVCEDPVLVVVSFSARSDGKRKHSLANIIRTGMFVVNLVEAWRILRRERPDVILSTGAGPAVPFALVGRLLGIPTVFVETFTRISSPSLTARIMYRLAARFVYQWPALARYFPRGVYGGMLA